MSKRGSLIQADQPRLAFTAQATDNSLLTDEEVIGWRDVLEAKVSKMSGEQLADALREFRNAIFDAKYLGKRAANLIKLEDDLADIRAQALSRLAVVLAIAADVDAGKLQRDILHIDGDPSTLTFSDDEKENALRPQNVFRIDFRYSENSALTLEQKRRVLGLCSKEKKYTVIRYIYCPYGEPHYSMEVDPRILDPISVDQGKNIGAIEKIIRARLKRICYFIRSMLESSSS